MRMGFKKCGDSLLEFTENVLHFVKFWHGGGSRIYIVKREISADYLKAASWHDQRDILQVIDWHWAPNLSYIDITLLCHTKNNENSNVGNYLIVCHFGNVVRKAFVCAGTHMPNHWWRNQRKEEIQVLFEIARGMSKTWANMDHIVLSISRCMWWNTGPIGPIFPNKCRPITRVTVRIRRRLSSLDKPASS